MLAQDQVEHGPWGGLGLGVSQCKGLVLAPLLSDTAAARLAVPLFQGSGICPPGPHQSYIQELFVNIPAETDSVFRGWEPQPEVSS